MVHTFLREEKYAKEALMSASALPLSTFLSWKILEDLHLQN